jgi:hypothetical protein
VSILAIFVGVIILSIDKLGDNRPSMDDDDNDDVIFTKNIKVNPNK